MPRLVWWEASATPAVYTGENPLVESVSRDEVGMHQGSCSRPGTRSIPDTVAAGCSSASCVAAGATGTSAKTPWGSLRECWWILIAHLCLLLVYHRILQQTVITMREGGNRKIWRKTSRVKGVSPTDSTQQTHGFTQTGFGCRPLAPSHPWHGVTSIGCEASLHLPLGPCLS